MCDAYTQETPTNEQMIAVIMPIRLLYVCVDVYDALYT